MRFMLRLFAYFALTFTFLFQSDFTVPIVFAEVQTPAYVGSKHSDRYHKRGCLWVQKIEPENRVSLNQSEIEAGKYVRCKVCWPLTSR